MVVDDFLKSSVGSYKRIKNKEDSFIYFKHQDIPSVSVLMTDGLSQFRMDVHEKHTGRNMQSVLSSPCLLGRKRPL